MPESTGGHKYINTQKRKIKLTPLTTITLVDDDVDDNDIFCAALGEIKPDVAVQTFNNGESLLQFLQHHSIDLLFLDINMAPLDGMQALKKIREDEKHANTPVVMFSSSGRPDDVFQSYRLGANLFIRKTETFDGLKKVLKKALELDWSAPEKIREQFCNTCLTGA